MVSPSSTAPSRSLLSGLKTSPRCQRSQLNIHTHTHTHHHKMPFQTRPYADEVARKLQANSVESMPVETSPTPMDKWNRQPADEYEQQLYDDDMALNARINADKKEKEKKVFITISSSPPSGTSRVINGPSVANAPRIVGAPRTEVSRKRQATPVVSSPIHVPVVDKGKGRATVVDSDDDVPVRPRKRLQKIIVSDDDEDEDEDDVPLVRKVRNTPANKQKIIVSDDDDDDDEDEDDVPLIRKVKKTAVNRPTGALIRQNHGIVATKAVKNMTIEDFAVMAELELRGKRSVPASDGDKDFRRSEYKMPTIILVPSGTSYGANPGDLSFHSILNTILAKGYKKLVDLQGEDPDLSGPQWAFLREMPAPKFADIILRGGMRPELVRLLSKGEPWSSDEFYEAAAPMSHARGSVGVYSVRGLCLADDEEDIITVHVYDGNSCQLSDANMWTRMSHHFNARNQAVQWRKPLYKILTSPDCVEAQAVVTVSLPTALAARFGRLPFQILEQGLIDLTGGWCNDRSPLSLFSPNREATTTETVWDWCLLPEALVDTFRLYAEVDKSASCRTIMREALKCSGTNTSMPLTEGSGVSCKVASLIQGYTQTLCLNKHNQTVFVLLADNWGVFLMTRSQTDYLRDHGFVFSTKGVCASTGCLKIKLEAQDHPEHLANLNQHSQFAEYEYARRVTLSFSWVDETRQSNEQMYVQMNNVQLSGCQRARFALSAYEYADGTISVGEHVDAKRTDFYRKIEDRAVPPAPLPARPCPGACGKSFGGYQAFFTHVSTEPLCKTAYDVLSKGEKTDLMGFYSCRGCGKKFINIGNLQGSGASHFKSSPRCKDIYGAEKATVENSSIFR